MSTEKSQVRKTFSARSRRAIKLSAISTEIPLSGQYKDHKMTSILMRSVSGLTVGRNSILLHSVTKKMALTVNTHHLLCSLREMKYNPAICSECVATFIVYSAFVLCCFRCKILDKHLATLAKKHVETKFIKLNVEKAPFLTERLRIKIIPTLALLLDGKSKDYVVGFTDLGNTDEFSTEMLEWRLGCADVINYRWVKYGSRRAASSLLKM